MIVVFVMKEGNLSSIESGSRMGVVGLDRLKYALREKGKTCLKVIDL